MPPVIAIAHTNAVIRAQNAMIDILAALEQETGRSVEKIAVRKTRIYRRGAPLAVRKVVVMLKEWQENEDG